MFKFEIIPKRLTCVRDPYYYLCLVRSLPFPKTLTSSYKRGEETALVGRDCGTEWRLSREQETQSEVGGVAGRDPRR